ncbi:hypothetical protein BDW66DRAFT_85278 [Aspergillus desertorum]
MYSRHLSATDPGSEWAASCNTDRRWQSASTCISPASISSVTYLGLFWLLMPHIVRAHDRVLGLVGSIDVVKQSIGRRLAGTWGARGKFLTFHDLCDSEGTAGLR